MSLSFAQHYFTEAKISALRQITNLYAKQQKMDLNLKKDLRDFHEIDEATFHNITDTLSRQYQSGEAEIQYRYKYRLLAKKEKGGYTKYPERSISNVYIGVLKGDKSDIEPYDKIEDVAVYETMRRLLYRGYIVVIVTNYAGIRKYFMGADRNGLYFFKQLTGMNMNTYVRLRVRPKRFITRSQRYEPKGEKTDKAKEVEGQPVSNNPGFVELVNAKEIYNEIKNKIVSDVEIHGGRVTKYNINDEYKDTIEATKAKEYGDYKSGIRYILKDTNSWFDVVRRDGSSDIIIVFKNKNAMIEAVEMGIFGETDLTDIDFSKDISKIK